MFKVSPLGAKDKTRLVEHGKLWKVFTGPQVNRPGFRLLESCKTGYVKWWRDEQIEECN